MGCLVLTLTRFLHTILYIPWVWGQVSLIIPCNDPSRAPLPHSMLCLTMGVTYLLCPLRSMVHFSSQSGLMPTIVCLMERSMYIHPTRLRWDQCHFNCLVRLEITLLLRLLSRLGATPSLVNKTLCKVSFLHRER